MNELPPEVIEALQRALDVLADLAATPSSHWWPTMDEILALPVTHDCPGMEWLA